MPINKGGRELSTLEDWERWAGPKSADQWVDGRSAKEAARAWLQTPNEDLPTEIVEILASHPAFEPVREWFAEPEVQLRFDQFAGEPRNSDLVVYAKDDFGPLLVAVEAKADETFGETAAEALAAALERRIENPRSNGVARIEQLAKALLGPRGPGEPLLKDIRYQLLTASAGALCEAERKGIDRAILLIHEFVTDKTLNENHDRNARDLGIFIKRLSHGVVGSVLPGSLYGPFTVPGRPLIANAIRLFIGKAVRGLRTKDT